MARVMFILYVGDQQRSARFYRHVLQREPLLDVPGLTEFQLTEESSLGLMPNAGVRRLLGEGVPDPAGGTGIPRVELYLLVEDAPGHHARALAEGARELSPPAPRPWGDRVGYCLDPDGHVLAFAEHLES